MKRTTAVKDPVCGMEMEAATGAGRTEHKARTCFCGSECREKFDVNPRQLPAAQGMEGFDVKLDVDVLPLIAHADARFTKCALVQQNRPKPTQQNWETES